MKLLAQRGRLKTLWTDNPAMNISKPHTTKDNDHLCEVSHKSNKPVQVVYSINYDKQTKELRANNPVMKKKIKCHVLLLCEHPQNFMKTQQDFLFELSFTRPVNPLGSC